MGAQRTDAEQQVAELLRTAKDALGLSVAFLTRMDGTTQLLEVVDSAHGNGTRVVAEGVETEPDVGALRSLGVDYGQGWFFGRPGPPAALGRAVEIAVPGAGVIG